MPKQNKVPECKVDLSIVIPAFEESKKIAHDIEGAITFLECQHFEGEVIVVDDGSCDDTSEAAKSVPASPGIPLRVIRYNHHRGKGYAVRIGVGKARGKYIMYADSGSCTPYENILLGMAMIKRGVCDIAHGSRKLLESEIFKSHVWYRRILSYIFRRIMIFWMGIPFELTDTQCGFKVYRGDIAKTLYGQCITDGFIFEIEIILRALKRGYHMREFPIEWTADRDSRLSVIRSPRRIIPELITIKRVLKNHPA